MDRLQALQTGKAEDAGSRFSNHGGNSRSHYPHMKAEDQNRVQNQVDRRSQHHGLHGKLGISVGADHGGQGRTEHQKRQAQYDHTGIRQSRLKRCGRCSKQQDDLPGKKTSQKPQQDSGTQQQRCRLADDPVCGFLILPAQIQIQICRAAVSDHQCHGDGHNGQRKCHIGGGHPRDAHSLPHKDLIHNIVQVIDQKRQCGGNGIFPEQLRDRCGCQRIGGVGFHREYPLFMMTPDQPVQGIDGVSCKKNIRCRRTPNVTDIATLRL